MNDRDEAQRQLILGKIQYAWHECYDDRTGRETRHYVGTLVSGLIARQGLHATARDLTEIDQHEDHLVRDHLGPNWTRHALEDAGIPQLEAGLALIDAKDGKG